MKANALARGFCRPAAHLLNSRRFGSCHLPEFHALHALNRLKLRKLSLFRHTVRISQEIRHFRARVPQTRGNPSFRLRRGSLPPFRLLSISTLRGYAAASRASSAPAGSFTAMSAPWPECLSLALCQSRTQLTASTGSGVCTHGSNGGEVSTANCTLRRGPGTAGTPGCHAGTRSLRSDQPRSVSGLPRGRTYPTVRNLTNVTSHVGWVLTEPVPREPGTARTEVESPAREEERGLLSSTPVPLAGPRSWTDLSTAREEERGLLSSTPVPLAGPWSWTDLSRKPKSLPCPRNGTPPRVLPLSSLKRRCTLGPAGRIPPMCTGWRLTLATAHVTSPDRQRSGLAASGEVTSQRRAT